MEVFHNGVLVFQSQRSWLNPLFDLEGSLKDLGVSPSELLIRDKIIGTASAFLIVSMGFKRVKAGVLSTGGEAVLRRFDLCYDCEERTDRMGCATEGLLHPSMEVEDAVAFLRGRIGGLQVEGTCL